MKKPVVSVLIPVYNTEKYISACLQSISQQSFTDFEIICIDDGSIDHSLQILKRIAQTESRLKIIEQSNQGVAATRNRLLQEATGEYIAFVDADDLIEPDYLLKLYQKAQSTKADITKCFFVEISEDGTQRMPARCSLLFYKHPTQELSSRFTCGYYDSVVWGKLFRREWLRKKHLSFFKNRIAEDLPFVILSFLYANTISVVAEPLYLYRKGLAHCITAQSERMIIHNVKNLLDLKTELQIRQLFVPQIQILWVRCIIWRICAFRKTSKQIRDTYDTLLKTAFSYAYEVMQQGNIYLKMRWKVLFVLVKICGWKSVYFWTKIFR